MLLLVASAVTGFFVYQMMQDEPSSNISGAPDASNVSAAMQQFVLQDPDGREFRLSEWSGRPLIVNFWATWCAPCREEVPLLVELQKEYDDKGLVVLGLSMDFPEDLDVVKRYMNDQNINYPVLMAADDGHTIAGAFGANNFVLPVSIFVRADGTVTNAHTGLLEREDAVKQLGKLF